MRYFIGFLVTIGLIVLIIVLLLGGGGKKGSSPVTPFSLTDYATGTTTAEMVIDGPIVADQKHQMLRIDVSQQQMSMTVYNGYEQNVVRSQAYPNNATSYAIFLHSLQLYGFTKHDTKVGYDERGQCPQGERYIMRFSDNGTDLRRSWTTSCGANTGSFRGNLDMNLWLFCNQIPDYDQLTQGTQL